MPEKKLEKILCVVCRGTGRQPRRRGVACETCKGRGKVDSSIGSDVQGEDGALFVSRVTEQLGSERAESSRLRAEISDLRQAVEKAKAAAGKAKIEADRAAEERVTAVRARDAMEAELEDAQARLARAVESGGRLVDEDAVSEVRSRIGQVIELEDRNGEDAATLLRTAVDICSNLLGDE